MRYPQPPPVVFVTGAFVTHHCWDEWLPYFERRGHRCYAPPHPNKLGDAAELRSLHPRAPVTSNTLAEVVRSYEQFIRHLPSKPILVGHSFGGLMVQLLLQEGAALGGIAINSVPPRGILTTKWSFLRGAVPTFGLLSSVHRSYLMTFRQWQYTFTNGMPLGVQRASYEQLVVPESKRLTRSPLTRAARIDFLRRRAPLLLLGGGTDHIIPPALNRANYRRYRHSPSITDYRELPGRNHFVLGQPSWPETADHVLAWIDTRLGAQLRLDGSIRERAVTL